MDVSFDGPAAAANALSDRVDVVRVAKRGNAAALTVRYRISVMFVIGPAQRTLACPTAGFGRTRLLDVGYTSRFPGCK
jgi:hypothetical protein